VATAAVNHVINCAGVTFLARMMAGGKFGIGDVIAAYSEVDRSSGALALRERLTDAPPETAHKGLLELEDALESATRDALEGKAGDGAAALEPVRARLEPAGVKVFTPTPRLATDNAAMIARAAFFRFERGERSGLDLNAYASSPIPGLVAA